MKALKAVLVVLGIWSLLAAGPGAVLPWRSVVRYIEILGYQTPPDHPLFVYCLRLASLGFALIGIFLLVLASDPVRYRPMLVLTVCGLWLTAIVALMTGWMTRMQPPWHLVDVAACSLAAVLILAFWPREVARAAGE